LYQQIITKVYDKKVRPRVFREGDLVLRKVLPLLFFFGKLTYVLKKEDTNIIRGIPQIYNDNKNIKQEMATG
jgi:hypothetical protein